MAIYLDYERSCSLWKTREFVSYFEGEKMNVCTRTRFAGEGLWTFHFLVALVHRRTIKHRAYQIDKA